MGGDCGLRAFGLNAQGDMVTVLLPYTSDWVVEFRSIADSMDNKAVWDNSRDMVRFPGH